MQSDWTKAFSYITWERFSQNMSFLQNHKDYGGSCKPKNSTLQGFPYWGVPPHQGKICSSPPPIPTNKNYPHKILIPPRLPPTTKYQIKTALLKKPKICMKFHKNSISCFLEKVVLINWLTGWQRCFHKTPFFLKTRVHQYH